MICPECSSPSRVYKTRKIDEIVLRRRACVTCNHRWKTTEMYSGPTRPYAGRRKTQPSDEVKDAFLFALKKYAGELMYEPTTQKT